MTDSINGGGGNDKPDPFDPAALRLSQDFVGMSGVKKLITTVRVKRPHRQEWVRVHPSSEYRETLSMIRLEEDREFFVVAPALHQALAGDTVVKVLYTAINRHGVVSLWPVTLPPSDGKDNDWWRSEREGAERAMAKWICLRSNMALGAYEILEGPPSLPEPEWPDITFRELLRLAFEGRLVNTLDHPVVKRLRGLA